MKRRWMIQSGLALLVGCLASAALLAAGCGREDTEVQAPPSTVAQGGIGAGPEPAFTLDEGLFVTIDEVKRELDRGAGFVLIDARPESEYEMAHITGAVSIPSSEIEERFTELPPGAWIVAYCACTRTTPTSCACGRDYAKTAVDELREHGYGHTAVLYESFTEWRDRSYPIVAGTEG